MKPTSISSRGSGGVAQRMLRRSRTEPSIGETELPAHPDEETTPRSRSARMIAMTRTESIIDLTTDSASNGSQSRVPHAARSQSQEDSSLSIKPVRPSLTSLNVRTYAGKSRSFLVALPNPNLGSASQELEGSSTIDDRALGGSQEEDFDTIRESYTDLRLRWGVDNSEDDPYPSTGDSPSKGGTRGRQDLSSTTLPPNMMNDLRSISELRSRGETRRFLDEMGYLFEGLDPSGALGVRRGRLVSLKAAFITNHMTFCHSALEIVSKLCDEDFSRRASAADFLGRAWDVLRTAGAGDGDKVRRAYCCK